MPAGPVVRPNGNEASPAQISSGDFRMDQEPTHTLTASASRALAHALSGYREPNSGRSTFEIAITAIPFVLIWVLMWAGLAEGYWICVVLALPAAGFLVRLFMIQHDCGHGSSFRHRMANDWVGRVTAVLCMSRSG